MAKYPCSQYEVVDDNEDDGDGGDGDANDGDEDDDAI